MLAWHDARRLAPDRFAAYEAGLWARALNGETVLGFARLERCALVGAFEDPHRALRLSYIGERFPIVRRRTGGGSLSLDPDTLMVVLAHPLGRHADAEPAALMSVLCAPLIAAIRALGVDAAFAAPNDIVVAGRKVASAFLSRSDGVILFEAALPLALDIEELLKTLRLPLEKLSAKGILAARQRYAPLRALVPDLATGGLRALLAAKMAQARGLDARREPPPSPARGGLLVQESRPPPDVAAFLKTPGGVLYLDAWLDPKGVVREARLTGAVACLDPSLFPRLETCLVSRHVTEIEPALTAALGAAQPDIIGVEAADIIYLGHLSAARFLVGRELGLGAATQISTFSPDRNESMDAILASIDAILLPYCAKPTWCKWRHRDGCPECGRCAVGEAYTLARGRQIDVTTITNFEHLRTVLADLKKSGKRAFLGVCCTDFFLKRDYAFVEAGIPAVFLDIAGDTCYTLRQEEEAYAGRFEAQAFMDARLFGRLLDWRDRLAVGQDAGVQASGPASRPASRRPPSAN